MSKLESQGIYRRVSSRLHADDKVRKLTKPPPCGLALWHELIFGEQTDVVPGLFRIGEAAFAEQLGWSLKGFRTSWVEILNAGLPVKADWKARLVWVRNAIHHNPPGNPKVILHWKRSWRDVLPECPLKEEARVYIGYALLSLYKEPKPYTDAFAEVTGKAIAKALPEPMPVPIGYQEAVNRKQEYVISAQSHEGQSTGPVDNLDLSGLADSDKAQAERLLASGQFAAATAFLASLKRSESDNKSQPAVVSR